MEKQKKNLKKESPQDPKRLQWFLRATNKVNTFFKGVKAR